MLETRVIEVVLKINAFHFNLSFPISSTKESPPDGEPVEKEVSSLYCMFYSSNAMTANM